MFHRNPRVLNFLRLAYIASGGLSFFALFTHIIVNVPQVEYLIGALLTVAFMLHEFVQSLRATSITSAAFKSLLTKKDTMALFIHAAFNWFVLLCLLAFNGMVLYNTFTLKDTGAPVWTSLQLDRLQAVLIPLLGLFASIIIDVEDNVSDVLRRTFQDILLMTTKATSAQWKTKVKKAKRQGVNLVPIVGALSLHQGDSAAAESLAIMEDGLQSVEVGERFNFSKLYALQQRMKSGATKLGLKSGSLIVPATANEPSTEPPVEGAKWASSEPRRKPRTNVKLTAEQKVRAYLSKNPGANYSQIEKAVGVSFNTARKWALIVQGESNGGDV